MVSSNWLNKWVMILAIGIVIQAIAYPLIWLYDIFNTAPSYPYFMEVVLIGIVSLIIQVVGFGIIMSKTRDSDPKIYGQGRPFQHKLREEDDELATRKPTFEGNA